MKLRPLFLAIFAIAIVFVGALFGQETAKPAPVLQYPLVKFEAAEQLGCPIELKVVSVSDRGPEALLHLRNTGTKGVRAYTIVIKADPRDYLWTTVIAPNRLEPGQGHSDPVTIIFPNQNKSGVVTVMFDYIEFADGTTWGADLFEKSKDIAKYRENRKIAIADLMSLLRGRDSADFQRELDIQPGFYSGEPVLRPDELSHKVNYNNKGYQSVILMLNHMKTHTDETPELVKKLQAMQKPSKP